MHHRFLRQVGGVARRLVLHLRVVLHTSPETAVGGPLALVKDGKPPQSDYDRGYAKLYIDHVMQAHQGADLDFLVGKSGAKVARESH